MGTIGFDTVVGTALFGAVALTTVGYVVGLAKVRCFERNNEGHVPWWFGYARDAINMGAGMALWILFVADGFAGPSALVVAVGLTLFVYGLDAFAAKLLGSRTASAGLVVITVAVATAIFVNAPAVEAGLTSSLTRLGSGTLRAAPR